jgi:DNA-binding transcriptional MerR regulator
MLAPQTAIARAKSPEAFRTISEVAAELDVPQHVLRFWESRFAQVKPVKRAGGRRYYRPEDVDLLRGIQSLLHSDGFTIRGVQKILRERGLRHVAQLGRASFGRDLDDGPSSEAEEVECALDESSELDARKPHHARAVLTAFDRDREAPSYLLAEEERIKLELLLAELLQLKSRLQAARARA